MEQTKNVKTRKELEMSAYMELSLKYIKLRKEIESEAAKSYERLITRTIRHIASNNPGASSYLRQIINDAYEEVKNETN